MFGEKEKKSIASFRDLEVYQNSYKACIEMGMQKDIRNRDFRNTSMTPWENVMKPLLE